MQGKHELGAYLTITLEGADKVTNDPNDPGGLTKYGISQRSYPDLDIRNLTYGDAAEIYKRDYWDKVAGDALPYPLDLHVADMAFNAGPGTAAIILQRALGNTAVDGKIGPKTLAAVLRLPVDEVCAMFNAERTSAYESMKNYSLYGKGWKRRIFRIINQIHAFDIGTLQGRNQ